MNPLALTISFTLGCAAFGGAAHLQSPAPAALPQDPPALANPLIDYPGFLCDALAAQQDRAMRRLTEAQFAAMLGQPDTVLLDARSADKFAMRHIQGAISLPFTDFTAASLAGAIPTKATRVLIYCNNNFAGDPGAFAEKSAPASLNISTYIALGTYGYTNVYELGPLLDVRTTSLPFAGTAIGR